MKRPLIIAATFIFASACSEPLQEPADISTETSQVEPATTIELSPEELCLVKQIANKTPKIRPETAQETAIQLLDLQSQSSSLTKKMSATVFCNKKQVYNSLTKTYKQEYDTAFYVFNTPDDKGFAIVAADVRVPNQVLAYSDNGNFDPDSDNPATELFIELAKDYVAEHIATAEAQEDSLTNSIYQKLGIKNENNNPNSLAKAKELMRIKCTTMGLPEITTINKGEVQPLLTTHWSQEAPYNNECQDRPVGCAPIAIAQILNYWQKPSRLYGFTINWNDISKNNEENNDFRAAVAQFIFTIRTEIYTKENGGTPPENEIAFFYNYNFTNQTQFNKYQFNQVADALEHGRPVFMGALSNEGGHAWVADGSVIREVITKQTFRYCIVEQEDDGTITDRYEDITTTTYTLHELLHFNWGWGGDADGYFNKGLFDTRKPLEENHYGEFMQMNDQNVRHKYLFNRRIETITDIYPRTNL